jgi:hypothetical protein
VHGLAGDDPRRLHLDPHARDVGKRALAVDRVAEAVHDAAEQPAADGDVHDGARAGHRVAFLDARVVAEDDDADVVALEVQRHAAHAGGGELHHLARHDVLQAVAARDPVADRQHRADLRDVRLGVEASDLLLQDVGNLGRTDVHGQAAPFMT